MTAPNMPSNEPESFGAPCRIGRLLDDGALSVVIDGKPAVLEIVGFAPSTGGPRISAATIDRIRDSNIPLRCRVVGPAGPGRNRAELHYLAWHDKSGDVWKPLTAPPPAEERTGNGMSGT